MMIERTMQGLIKMFERAEEVGAKYIGIVVEMEGFEKNEIIINDIENMRNKLEYYKKTYDEELNHKYSKGIKIDTFWFEDDIEDLVLFLKAYI